MNILVVSKTEWDDRNAFGNTISNFFSNWKDCNFFHIFTRTPSPSNNVCNEYYRVSFFNIIKNILTPWRIGQKFSLDTCKNSSGSVSERKIISYGKKGRKLWMHIVYDLIYSSCIWKNSRYKRTIQSFIPDIVFFVLTSDAFIYQNIIYLKTHTNAKFVCMIQDDVYGVYSSVNGYYGKVLKNRLRKCLTLCDKVYGASQMLCDEYEKQFSVSIMPLYKGCELLEPRTSINNPIIITYAGNLGYERYKTLASLVQAIQNINCYKTNILLKIYTGSEITEEISALLNIPGSSEICGRAPYDVIKRIQHESDIVLHVESFSAKQIELVKYSLSTKIIDCLQSGAAMMVIGPAGISPIEYPRQIPGTIVVDHIDALEDVLNGIISNKIDLINRAKQIHRYAMTHHNIEIVRENIRNDFADLFCGDC